MDNERWVVAKPSGGRYEASCFRLEKRGVASPQEGQVQIETRLFSLDPTHLNWVKLDPKLQFIPIGVDDPMIGTNIGIVRESRVPGFVPGQAVMGVWGWERIANVDPAFVGPALPETTMPFADQLTVLSHVGQAAAGGMLVVGNVGPGDTVLVSAAAGATGSIAAQIARAKGCFTVGIAGGAAKCRYLVEDLRLDAAIDYRAGNVSGDIGRLFPNGVDLFFDNVGGDILDAALDHLATRGRIAICGAISQYDTAGPDFAGIRNLPALIFRQGRMEGFVAGQFGARNDEIRQALLDLYTAGQLRTLKDIVSFAEMPTALLSLLNGTNRGKLMAAA